MFTLSVIILQPSVPPVFLLSDPILTFLFALSATVRLLCAGFVWQICMWQASLNSGGVELSAKVFKSFVEEVELEKLERLEGSST